MGSHINITVVNEIGYYTLTVLLNVTTWTDRLPSVMILTIVHQGASDPKKQLTSKKQVSSNLRCAACTAWPSCLCCEANIPWLQDNLSWFVLREEAAGSSHLTPAITPPVWPCLLSKSAPRSSHKNVLPVWQKKWWIQLFSCNKILYKLQWSKCSNLSCGQHLQHAACMSEVCWMLHNSGFPASKGTSLLVSPSLQR